MAKHIHIHVHQTRDAAGERLIDTQVSGNEKTKVYYSAQNAEYRVEYWINGVYQRDADYFTDDKSDALGSAKAMLQKKRNL